MELIAKLIQILPVQSGTGKNGPWKKQDIVVETTDQYPKKICISIWGDKVNISSFSIDTLLNISFKIESREYSGKWYTDVKAWRIEQFNQETAAKSIADKINESLMDDEDVLPF